MISSFRLRELCAIAIYKVLLDITYYYIQMPLFSYQGYEFEYDVGRALLSWAITLVVSAFITANQREDACTIFILVVFELSIMPFLTLFSFDKRCELWMVLLQIAALLIMQLLFRLVRNDNDRTEPRISYKSSTCRTIITGFLLFYFALQLIQYGVPTPDSLLFENVYDTRASASFSTIETIVQNIMCKFICPLYMLIAYNERKWVFFAISLLIQLYMYAITGFKTFLFIPIMLIALQLIPKARMRDIIMGAFPVVVAIGTIVYLVFGSKMGYAVLVNRLLYMPARIKWCYFDYFSTHDFVFYSQNTLAGMFGITSNYSIPIQNLIGAEYFDKGTMWTNTGFIAEAYSNGGVIAVFATSIILALLIILARRFTAKASTSIKRALIAVLVVFYVSLNDGGAVSVLFSGGMLISILAIGLISFCDSDSQALISCSSEVDVDLGGSEGGRH